MPASLSAEPQTHVPSTPSCLLRSLFRVQSSTCFPTNLGGISLSADAVGFLTEVHRGRQAWAGECHQKPKPTAEDGQKARDHQAPWLRNRTTEEGTQSHRSHCWSSPCPLQGTRMAGLPSLCLSLGLTPLACPKWRHIQKSQHGHFPPTGLGTTSVPGLSRHQAPRPPLW